MRSNCLHLGAEIRALYWDQGLSLAAVGRAIGFSASSVYQAMVANDIPRRSKQKKSGSPTYRALHLRVEAARGTPKHCEECGNDDPDAWYEWASLTGDYENILDYRRMCRSCHRRYDDARRGGRPWRRGQPMPWLSSQN